jgi:DNA modification methylase
MPGETVIDNCMGSGTTGVACVNTERRFIGMEQKREYFEIAQQRIEHAVLLKKAGAEVLKPATDRDPHTVDLFGAAP